MLQKNENEDTAYNFFSNLLRSDVSRMWTSVDLHNEYANLGGTKLTRSKIIESPLVDCKVGIIVMSSLGLVNILIFKCEANELIGIQEIDDQDETHIRC